MSVGAQTKASGSSDAGVAGGGQSADRGTAAGMLFGRLTVLPALVAMAWLVVGLPLLLLGWFTPVAMLLVTVPVVAVIVYFGLRLLPGKWEGAQLAWKPGRVSAPWWSVIGVIVVAVAFGVDQMIYHSQFIIVTRDPASYVQFAAWISKHGSLPIPQDNAAFGGIHKALSFGSPAYYQVGRTIVPQFMAGLPMVLAGGFWIGGVGAAVAMGPILGALAVLTFGGLAGWSGRSGLRLRRWYSRSLCPCSSRAARPTASRWPRSCFLVASHWSSTAWARTDAAPGFSPHSGAWRSA